MQMAERLSTSTSLQPTVQLPKTIAEALSVMDYTLKRLITSPCNARNIKAMSPSEYPT